MRTADSTRAAVVTVCFYNKSLLQYYKNHKSNLRQHISLTRLNNQNLIPQR